MSIDDLQDQVTQLCAEVMHEATDRRLTASEVFEYLKVINSAARIGTTLSRRIDRIGYQQTQIDIFRFAAVAFGTIEKVRQAVKDRERDPLSDAWNEDE